MNQTDHHLLVGKGAQTFARNLGFTIEDDLNTPLSRKLWLEWKQRTDPRHYLTPKEREIAFGDEGRPDGGRRPPADGGGGLFPASQMYGTINCDGINAKGEICGVTTTSGLFFKIPGRVGDSPILGAGLYVDGQVGAAGSTGRGEANLFNLSSYFIVECMRRGMHPKDAGMEALKRIKANTIEKRLLNPAGNPSFNINFYAVEREGRVRGRRDVRPRGRREGLGRRDGPARPLRRLRREGPADAAGRGTASGNARRQVVGPGKARPRARRP